MALWNSVSPWSSCQISFSQTSKIFILGCFECKLLWSIADSCLYLTLCDCSPSCFDPDYLLLAFLWLRLSWIGCISTIKHFPYQNQATGTLHQQQAAGEAHQKHIAENTIKRSWRASWPRVARRALSGLVALGAPVGSPDAVVPFPDGVDCAPSVTGWLRGARGGRPRTGLIVPAAGPHRGRGAGLAPRRTRSGPRDGVVPGGPPWRRSWATSRLPRATRPSTAPQHTK